MPRREDKGLVIHNPPCDKCAYQETCIIECQSFTSYVYWGRTTEPPKLKKKKHLTHE